MSNKQFSAERGHMIGPILISPKQSEQRAIKIVSLQNSSDAKQKSIRTTISNEKPSRNPPRLFLNSVE